MNNKKLLLSILVLFIAVSGFSQTTLNPVKWECTYESLGNKEGYIIIKAIIEKDWHIYSQSQSSDGPIPTSFIFAGSTDFEPVDKTLEPLAEKAYSEVFDTDVISFANEVIFKQKIRRKNAKAFELNGELEFMACNNSMCLPPKTIKFSVQIPAAGNSK